jgi:NAD(P)-dependent dehydrogenase (short-subunit alcohol dehydrogenase family)
MTDMNGLTAIVTGGGSGIGLATAKILLERGANVVIAGRTAKKLEEAAASLNCGPRLSIVTADIASEGHAKSLVSQAVRLYGGVSIVINNAGVFQGGSILETEEEDFDHNLNVNLKGTWFMCKYAARPLIDGGGGAIVNVSSILAIRAHPLTPASAYAAAKGGVVSLTRELAVELAPFKIRVNCVLPALVNTPMLSSLVAPEKLSRLLEKSKHDHPIGRAGESEDVAKAIVFLADPSNDWLTGVEMTVDGGRSVL